jgi:6-phosphogluconolactonase (cycloisomerase 2 family)
LSLRFDPTGKYLYAPNSLGDSISRFLIDPISGRLMPSNPPTPTGIMPFCIDIVAGLQ